MPAREFLDGIGGSAAHAGIGIVFLCVLQPVKRGRTADPAERIDGGAPYGGEGIQPQRIQQGVDRWPAARFPQSSRGGFPQAEVSFVLPGGTEGPLQFDP